MTADPRALSVGVAQRRLLEALASFGVVAAIPEEDRPTTLFGLGTEVAKAAGAALDRDQEDAARVFVAFATLIGAVASERQEMAHG